jgi:hypothetical protein
VEAAPGPPKPPPEWDEAPRIDSTDSAPRAGSVVRRQGGQKTGGRKGVYLDA